MAGSAEGMRTIRMRGARSHRHRGQPRCRSRTRSTARRWTARSPLVAAAAAQAVAQHRRVTLYSCVSGAPLHRRRGHRPALLGAPGARAGAVQPRRDRTKLHTDDTVFVEVGPGQALTALAAPASDRRPAQRRASSRSSAPRASPAILRDAAFAALGELWCAGVRSLAGTGRRAPPAAADLPLRGRSLLVPRRGSPGQRAAALSSVANSFTAPAVAPATAALVTPAAAALVVPAAIHTAYRSHRVTSRMSRLPSIEQELNRILAEVSGIGAESSHADATFVDQGLDSLSLTQSTLELEQVFGLKLRFRRLMEDLGTLQRARPRSSTAPARRADVTAAPSRGRRPPAMPAVASVRGRAGHARSRRAQPALRGCVRRLRCSSSRPADAADVGATRVASAAQPGAAPRSARAAGCAATRGRRQPPRRRCRSPRLRRPPLTAGNSRPRPLPTGPPRRCPQRALVDAPFGASPRITLEERGEFSPAQRHWLDDFIARYNARSRQVQNLQPAASQA